MMTIHTWILNMMIWRPQVGNSNVRASYIEKPCKEHCLEVLNFSTGPYRFCEYVSIISFVCSLLQLVLTLWGWVEAWQWFQRAQLFQKLTVTGLEMKESAAKARSMKGLQEPSTCELWYSHTGFWGRKIGITYDKDLASFPGLSIHIPNSICIQLSLGMRLIKMCVYCFDEMTENHL